MEKTRVLFVSEEITPYLKESHIGKIGRHLPQGIQEKGKEIRTFMPRFGNINERRNQLHEVIRLSGMNLIIDDLDHPLIIKVASIQAARMQVYFIDNEDYFHRKFLFRDKNEKFFEDNDERAMFFARGVVETVKKLGWAPDVIHCHGWFASLLPLYLKTMYKDNPLFSDSKIVISVYDDEFEEKLSERFFEKLKMDEMEESFLAHYKEAGFINLMKGAIDHADAVIMGSEQVNEEVAAYIKETGKPALEYQDMDNYIVAYNEFYDQLVS